MEGLRIIAGPCSVESLEGTLAVARALAGSGTEFFRGGLWKPRTHPGTFEGVGTEGLPWLLRVREETGLKVCTEVASAAHVEACLDAGLDAVWIGARTTTNPFLVQEIADALRGADATVMVKNPVTPDLELWTGAIERISAAGIGRVIAVHRGVTPQCPMTWRNDPCWSLAVGLRTRMKDLPLLCDPSHIAGDRRYVREIAAKALDLGLDGLMVEVHDNPQAALSDPAQQLDPKSFLEMLSSMKLRSQDSTDPQSMAVLEGLRAQMDSVDESLVRLLASRMELSRKVGECKKGGNMSIIQPSRWDKVLSGVVAEGRSLGLDGDFVRKLFCAIHEESVRTQGIVLSGDGE